MRRRRKKKFPSLFCQLLRTREREKKEQKDASFWSFFTLLFSPDLQPVSSSFLVLSLIASFFQILLLIFRFCSIHSLVFLLVLFPPSVCFLCSVLSSFLLDALLLLLLRFLSSFLLSSFIFVSFLLLLLCYSPSLIPLSLRL